MPKYFDTLESIAWANPSFAFPENVLCFFGVPGAHLKPPLVGDWHLRESDLPVAIQQPRAPTTTLSRRRNETKFRLTAVPIL